MRHCDHCRQILRIRLSHLKALFAFVLCTWVWGNLLNEFAWPQSEKDAVCPECSRVFDGYAVSESEQEIELTLIMARPIQPLVFTLQDPPRLVVDLKPAWTEGLPLLGGWTHPILEGPIRMAWKADDRQIRLVLDLLEDRTYDVTQDLYLGEGPMQEGARFVLTVKQQKKEEQK